MHTHTHTHTQTHQGRTNTTPSDKFKEWQSSKKAPVVYFPSLVNEQKAASGSYKDLDQSSRFLVSVATLLFVFLHLSSLFYFHSFSVFPSSFGSLNWFVLLLWHNQASERRLLAEGSFFCPKTPSGSYCKQGSEGRLFLSCVKACPSSRRCMTS